MLMLRPAPGVFAKSIAAGAHDAGQVPEFRPNALRLNAHDDGRVPEFRPKSIAADAYDAGQAPELPLNEVQLMLMMPVMIPEAYCGNFYSRGDDLRYAGHYCGYFGAPRGVQGLGSSTVNMRSSTKKNRDSYAFPSRV